MERISAGLRPIVNNINLPTVLKTAILPGESVERLFIATQVGEILCIRDGVIESFLDISHRVSGIFEGGYDERGLLGLAFHPEFNINGLFYLHYSIAGTQGPGALAGPFIPDPCDPETLSLEWTNRNTRYDHIDTVEEWILEPHGQPQQLRTLLNLRRPFSNHNGVNSLNFSPETGKLILTTGDGGSGYDPFNLAQNNIEIAGKVIEIDVEQDAFTNSAPVVSRFDELPVDFQESLSVIVKGVRNIPGISFQIIDNGQYIKYLGNVGQNLIESIFTFTEYSSIPVTQIVEEYTNGIETENIINLGWKGWEGDLPTLTTRVCPASPSNNEKVIAYYDEAIATSTLRELPLVSYYHDDPREDKFRGTALTGVQPYMGNEIPDLTGKIIFSDFVQQNVSPPRGVLAYTDTRSSCRLNDFGIIEPNYDFGSRPAFYVSLGANRNSSSIYLGVYASSNVTDFNQGTVFELVR